MRTAAARALHTLAQALLWLSVAIFVTGGATLALGEFTLRARSFANPIAWALLLAAGARLLAQGVQPDGVERFRDQARALLHRLFGPGAERLRAVLRFRAEALLLALAAVWMLDRCIADPLEIEGDAVGYYAYVRSWVIDRDIDFRNEYRDFDPRRQWLTKRTAIRRVENPFAIGPAILWLPFFGLGHAGAAAVGAPLHGYSPPFLYATAAGTWLMGVAGLVLLYRLLLRQFRRSIALAAALGTAFASPLGYYLAYAPHYSHVQSFFVTLLFLGALVRTRGDGSHASWALLGAVSGLLAITRWQDAVYWIMPFGLLLHATFWRLRRDPWPGVLLGSLGRGLAFLAALALAVFPQLLVFKRLNGFWFGVPQGEGFVEALPYWIGPTLFSWNHGLYSWSPLLLVATIGLLAAALRRRPWALAFLGMLLVHIYFNSCLSQWWAGHSFGARRFSSAVPLFALGLAEVFERASRHRAARALLAGLTIALVVLTHALGLQWNAGQVPHDQPIDPIAVLGQAGADLLSGRLFTLESGSLTSLIADRLMDLITPRLPFFLAAGVLYGLVRRRSAGAGGSGAAAGADVGHHDRR